MNIRLRRLIYFIFIFLFLISAPLLILYTAGYRYNWRKNKVEQVGVLIIDVKPADARLYLDRRPLRQERPLILNDLAPNYYLVRAEKDGHFPWQKNLEIKNKESVLLYDVVLFRQTNPLLLTKGKITDFAFSKKEDKLAYAQEGRVFLYSPFSSSANASLLYQSPRAAGLFQELTWSENGNFILSKEGDKNQNRFAVLDVNNPEQTLELRQITPLNFSNLSWHPFQNHLLYGLSGGNLYKINLNLRRAEKILEKTESFGWQDGALYFTGQNNGAVAVFRYDPFPLFGKSEKIGVLPAGRYQLLAGQNNYLVALEAEQNNIYLLNVKNKNEAVLKFRGSRAVWNESGKNNLLFFYNASELWFFDPKIKKSGLISRFSSGLKEVAPLSNLPYFIYNLNDVLYIAELDERDKRNIFNLFQGRAVEKILVDKKAKHVYFLDKMDEKTGLFELEIF